MRAFQQILFTFFPQSHTSNMYIKIMFSFVRETIQTKTALKYILCLHRENENNKLYTYAEKLY